MHAYSSRTTETLEILNPSRVAPVAEMAPKLFESTVEALRAETQAAELSAANWLQTGPSPAPEMVP